MSLLKINLPKGKYIVAVSGGVDSIVMLDLLCKNYKLQTTNYKLIAAHFDHGIRQDSNRDRMLVEKAAKEYGLEFVYGEGDLGPNASEEKARKARYEFLFKVLSDNEADAIITAHHQDDALETAVINIVRGTGPRGLTALKSQPRIIRPLLDYTKAELLSYAEKNGLAWHEDPTNRDITYLRNYVRHQLLARLSKEQKHQLLQKIEEAGARLNDADEIMKSFFGVQPSSTSLNRHQFIMLPHMVAKEVVAGWLRNSEVKDFDKKTIERLVWAGKTFHPGKTADINKNKVMKIKKDTLDIAKR